MDQDLAPVQGVLPGYQPPPGVQDEYLDAQGNVRPLWTGLAAHLAGLSADDLAHHMGRADQYLLDSGVFFRQYGGGQSVERPWPLSHVPVLIGEDDWTEITQALVQRADLLEMVMADLYGPNALVAAGRLPAELVAANPEWLRPMVGVSPRSGKYLHFLAFELGRGPDGRWWVLADRAQAPSGAGYALENRVAIARAFAEHYAKEHVHRLAGFFRDFRDALIASRHDNDSRVAILTPGPLNDTYFEHAYIARYLGFNLVQGEDLTVTDGRLMLRTVSGLRPVEVLWRRLDASYADPLELERSSRLGTPGLLSALRAGGFDMVNALGSGVLETRALMAFLPKLCRHLTGQPLRMNNIATWWCGDPAARAEVLATPERMILSPAFATGMPFDSAGPIPEPAGASLPDTLADRLARDGGGLVAQEAVTLSTTPTIVGGQFVARPMSLRVFLARTPQGWIALPGGFARIGSSPDPSAIAMQRGGSAADVWVVSRAPVETPTLSVSDSVRFRRAAPGALPSRSADNLFWLGRYVERTEAMVRLLRAAHVRRAEANAAAEPLLAAMGTLFTGMGVDLHSGIPQGLLDTIASALNSAGRVRDRFSPDAWSALVDIDKTARRMALKVKPGDDAARALSALLRKLAGISGLVHENMYRFAGWRFLTIGRLQERASQMARLLQVLTDPGMPPGALDLLIEVGDSVLTHRRRFSIAAAPVTVIDLLALDALNPRSLRHQVDGLREQIDALPSANEQGSLSPLARAVLRLHADLATADPQALTPADFKRFREQVGALSDLLTEAYLR
ncbi:MAG: circularly permuted type 2 ATP-grasp protein [Pseudooceanicola sp.]|nr:circularly permuted type 2 ATP-grasp protein [Pseudooceanicola sp.]